MSGNDMKEGVVLEDNNNQQEELDFEEEASSNSTMPPAKLAKTGGGRANRYKNWCQQQKQAEEKFAPRQKEAANEQAIPHRAEKQKEDFRQQIGTKQGNLWPVEDAIVHLEHGWACYKCAHQNIHSIKIAPCSHLVIC